MSARNRADSCILRLSSPLSSPTPTQPTQPRQPTQDAENPPLPTLRSWILLVLQRLGEQKPDEIIGECDAGEPHEAADTHPTKFRFLCLFQ